MMVLSVVLPVCVFLLAVGLRVLLLSRKDGGVAERMIGVAFLGMGLGGLPALFAGNPDVIPAAWAQTCFGVGQAIFSIAFSAFYLFAWRCFGPGSGWRRALALFGITSQVLVFVSLGLVEGFQPPGGDTLRVAASTRAIAIIWAFGESFHYWRLMQRRQVLGLVDPVVTNRFMLWACWTGSLMGMMGIAVVLRFIAPALVLDLTHPSHMLLLGSSASFVSLSAMCLALAFFPPTAYSSRVRRRAGV